MIKKRPLVKCHGAGDNATKLTLVSNNEHIVNTSPDFYLDFDIATLLKYSKEYRKLSINHFTSNRIKDNLLSISIIQSFLIIILNTIQIHRWRCYDIRNMRKRASSRSGIF